MEPIRVLQVVGRMDRGGIETLIMNLYRNIDRTKVQFDFLCHYGKEAEYNDEIRKLGGRIFEMPTIKSSTHTYYHRIGKYAFALNKFFETHTEYKILHGHMTNTASIYMPLAKKHGIECCIAHSHLSKSRKGMSGFITDILKYPLSKIATDYFSCSKTSSEWLFNKNLIENDKVITLNNAVDTSLFKYDSEVRKEYRQNLNLEEKYVVGHVGRFYYEKNHSFLIEVFNEIQKVKSNSVLLLAGDGVLMNQMKEKVEGLRLSEKVIFLGSRNDIPSLLQVMDVFVMPSHFEGLPVVGIEAQASGLPCIFSDVITNEIEVTNNINFYSLKESPIEWANKILKSTSNFSRKDTSHQIINNGYEISSTAKWLQNFYIEKHFNS
ncbi:glycosyltransferase family 1 protein [Planococcus rifietoensis]|uniref:glycosyltransferase family 1 protein n=1 Tax=Planococcus rifietoensis TaxID=200991 RepID=UPI00384CCB72